MATILRWWWVTAAPMAISGLYIGRQDISPLEVDSSIYELMASIIPPASLSYSSPLARASLPAKQLHQLTKSSGEVVLLDALLEQDFGLWEGKTFQEVQQLVEASHPISGEDIADLRPDQGESFSQLCRRVQLGIDTITYQVEDSSPSREVNILCVAPISVVRAALSHALDITPQQALRLQLQPLCLSVVEKHENFGWFVHTTGWTPWPLAR